MALSKTVFIDRGNRENARLAFDGAARQMKSERQSVYIFPEGTRSYTSRPDLLPFKKGAFHLAVQARVPIVPIVVANYSNILHFQTRTFKSGKIPVKSMCFRFVELTWMLTPPSPSTYFYRPSIYDGRRCFDSLYPGNHASRVDKADRDGWVGARAEKV